MHAAAFTATRALQVLVGIPIIGMIAFFVHPYVHSRSAVPGRLLAFFIISILSTVWALATLYQFRKLRNVTGPLIAIVDLLFMGAWIACVILYRGLSNANCGHLSVPIGIQLGDKNYSGGKGFGYNLNKQCAMYKSAWALSIVEIILFFITAVLSYLLWKNYKRGTTVTTKSHGRRSGSTSEYSTHRHGRHRSSHV
jgi:hypothetical protein